MTAEERYALVEEALARELAERVVQKLLDRQKQALVVYTGSNLGSGPALEALRGLRAEGFTFRVLLSHSAANILDVGAIRSALEPAALWVDRPEESPEALTARYDTILVPALTVNTAAHVASCMADTPAAAIILDGLMRGKNVIAAIDGCCPDNSERAARGFRMAEPLKQRLRDNMETLRSYGARLTTAERLKEKTLKAIRDVFPTAERPEPARQTAAPAQQSETRFQGKVLSGRSIVNCPLHSTLWVPKGTLVTQLAADEARRRDVCIRIET